MPNLSRRHLVTTAAALPALAMPAAVLPAAALPAAAAPAIDSREAMVVRARQIVDVLGSCYVREGWKLDADRAAQFVESVGTFDEDDGTCPKFRMVLDWMRDHGQSLDWLADGDPAGLITARAALRATVGTPVDAELIALGDELQSLWPKFLTARDALNEAHEPDGGPAELKYNAINCEVSELAAAIMVIPVHTLAGLRAKVMASIHVTDGYFWGKSFDNLDGDHQGARSLMEAVCVVTGIDIAKHLGAAMQDVIARKAVQS